MKPTRKDAISPPLDAGGAFAVAGVAAQASTEPESAGNKPTPAEPVTIVFAQKVRRGGEHAYRDWVEAFQGAMRRVPGFLGASTIGRGPGQDQYVSLARFDSIASLLAWEQSDTRREWIGKLPLETVQGDAEIRRLEGLEFWFTPPQGPLPPAPSAHKMAILLVPVVFVLVITLTPLLRLVLAGVPLILRTLVMVVLQVGLMTYVVMPRVTKAFAGWLFRRGGSS